jgi:RNA polymerase sigma factor
MQEENRIVKAVYAAKKDSARADELIRAYIPFILATANKNMPRPCTEQDDEYSIVLMAFYEAILGYDKGKGSFLSYAEMLIKSRLIDYARKESRHSGNISLSDENAETGVALEETLADGRDYFDEIDTRDATRQEIEELVSTFKAYGITLDDVIDNCPKQERTLSSCASAIRYASEHKELLEELVKTKRLPIAELVRGSGTERKTLERHRKYILAMLLIQTNGFVLLRGHLSRILRRKEATK